MEVDPSDKNQSPCFQRHQILKKIEIEKMTLKTFKELHQKYQNSDPSLAETTNDAADEHQLKLDALVNSMEDFVFPTKTARPASPSISEPVAITNSFSNLEEDKNQEVEEEAKIAVVPKPRPHNPFILKLQKTFEIK
ncbi:hypothetical protein TNCV_4251201 [Trichonephila clavipes]|nr:hypothetical protein TNCV_4251201 [Trichonephila clavipes]